MCKFENVQMCKYYTRILLVFFTISPLFGVAQKTNIYSEQFTITYKFVRLLEAQKTDSILLLVKPSARKDSTLKSELQQAQSFVRKSTKDFRWSYVRIGLNPDIIECHLMNGTSIELCIRLTFIQGTNIISRFETLDQSEMKSAGMSIEDIDVPPPSFEVPPAPPKPKN